MVAVCAIPVSNPCVSLILVSPVFGFSLGPEKELSPRRSPGESLCPAESLAPKGAESGAPGSGSGTVAGGGNQGRPDGGDDGIDLVVYLLIADVIDIQIDPFFVGGDVRFWVDIDSTVDIFTQ
jgi:hypothetical protein